VRMFRIIIRMKAASSAISTRAIGGSFSGRHHWRR
jgi:hypothetical protein